MLGFKSTTRRGDTIVEVIFAVSIFSMVAVAGISLMNRGMATAQGSMEITVARQQVDNQAETIRFLHSAYVNAYEEGASYTATTPAGQYATILSSRVKSAATNFVGLDTCPTSLASQDFIVDPRTAQVKAGSTYVKSDTYPRIVYSSTATTAGYQKSEGVWVEAVRSTPANSGGVGFIDFHIRSCWYKPSDNVPLTLGTVVRLYDPRK